MQYTIVIRCEPNGRYSGFCPGVTGCASQGESLEQTRENIRQAIIQHLAMLHEFDAELPADVPVIVEELEIPDPRELEEINE